LLLTAKAQVHLLLVLSSTYGDNVMGSLKQTLIELESYEDIPSSSFVQEEFTTFKKLVSKLNVEINHLSVSSYSGKLTKAYLNHLDERLRYCSSESERIYFNGLITSLVASYALGKKLKKQKELENNLIKLELDTEEEDL
jgi:hypothetical protein